MRFFNTEGPVDCARHYCLPPLERLDLTEILILIEQQKYFLLHAPRQTGKTSCLLALADYLNREGRDHAIYANYADRCGADEAHLVVFDRRPARPWEERIWTRPAQYNDLPITIWGM